MCKTVIESYYKTNGVVTFNNPYTPDKQLLSGISVNETVDFVELYDVYTNEEIGKIQFNNINKKTLGNPISYVVTENISIQLNDSSLFASNYYKSINNNYYPTGSKYIISIASGSGDFATKKGFIVIDALENKRLVTIVLD